MKKLNSFFKYLTQVNVRRWLILLSTLIVLGWLWHYFVTYRPWDIRIPNLKAVTNRPDYEFSHIAMREVSGPLTYFELRSNYLALDKTKAALTTVSGNVLNKNQKVFYFEAKNAIAPIADERLILKELQGKTIAGAGHAVWFVQGGVAYFSKRGKTFVIEQSPKLWTKDIEITSPRFTYHVPFQSFALADGVTVKYGEAVLNCTRAVLQNNLDQVVLEEAVVLTTKDYMCKADQVTLDYIDRQYHFERNVHFVEDTTTIVAEDVLLAIPEQIVTFNHQVVLVDGDIKVTTDKAVLKRKQRKIYFYDHTKAEQKGTIINSDLIVLDLHKKQFIAAGSGRTKISKDVQ